MNQSQILGKREFKMSIIVLIGACYIPIPIVILPHIIAYIHNFSPYFRWGMQQTTCKCLTLSYIYILSSTSVHGKSLNMINQMSNIGYNVWLIVCSVFEAYLMYFFLPKKACAYSTVSHTIRHDRLKTPQHLHSYFTR